MQVVRHLKAGLGSGEMRHLRQDKKFLMDGKRRIAIVNFLDFILGGKDGGKGDTRKQLRSQGFGGRIQNMRGITGLVLGLHSKPKEMDRPASCALNRGTFLCNLTLKNPAKARLAGSDSSVSMQLHNAP
jgi:hypothetical protein